MSEVNRQIRLARRPRGDVRPEDWEHHDAPVEPPEEGQFAARTRYLSLDPAMRGWLDDRPSYVPPVGLGEVMRAGSIVEVTASRHPDYRPRDLLVGMFGVQEQVVSDGAGARKVDPGVAPVPTYLAGLGMTGMTAYFGLLDIGRPQEGDTVVVSGAAGAVGSVVGQIAKIKGCRVVGIAGGPEKCASVIGEFGFDTCIDYRDGNVRDALRVECPDGIDVYFDNVGGEILDAALANLAPHARVVICGAISQYNNREGMYGPRNYMALLVRRARMEGFLVFDYAPRFGEAASELAGWMLDRRLKSHEQIVKGTVDDFPATLQMLFRGENTGKLILELT